MRKRTGAQWVCIILLLGVATAAGALAAQPFDTLRAWVDRYAGDGSADPYTSALHGRLRVAAAATSLICVGLAFLLFRYRPEAGVFKRIRIDAQNLRLQFRATCHRLGLGLIAVTALSAALRMPYIDQPMRFDESYTYLQYASRPAVILLATYNDPNNHVLHSLLVHGVTRILGELPWVIRLPAFAAGVLIAPATMLLARISAGRHAGWFAGLLTAASSPLIEYSTNARGYTMLVLLTVLCWLLAEWGVRRQNRLAWWLLGGGLALGAWTIPIMLYPAAMLLAWIAFRGCRAGPWRRRGILRGIAVAVGVACALVLLMYMPILLVSGAGVLMGNQFVGPSPWSEYLALIGPSVADAWSLLLRDVAGPSVIALAIGFLYGAVSQRLTLAPAVATVLVCLLLTAIQRVLPPARAWLFLVPLAAVVTATGFAQLAAHFTGRRKHVAATVLVLLTVLWPAAACLSSGSVLQSDETGACPDARQIVALLAPTLRPGEPIIAASPVSAPLVYYADRAGVAREHFDPLDTFEQPIGPAIAVVSRVQEQSLTDVLEAFHAPAELGADGFEAVAHFPSATVYRRDDPEGN